MAAFDLNPFFVPTIFPWQQEQPQNSSNILATLQSSGAVISISPHPDDDVIGMGGLLGLMAGHRPVVSIYITDGAGSLRSDPPDRIPWLRKQEACAALRRLGITGAFFLEAKSIWLANPEQPEYIKTKQILEAIFSWIKPQEVYATGPFEAHPTHIRCTEMVMHALRTISKDLTSEFQFWGYPVWGPLIGDTNHIKHVAVDAMIYTKAEAITAHAGEVGYKPYHEGALGRNCYQAVFHDAHTQVPSQYMEVFLNMTDLIFGNTHLSLAECAQKHITQYLAQIYPKTELF